MEDVRAEPTDEPRLLACGVDVEGGIFWRVVFPVVVGKRHPLESAWPISFFPLVFTCQGNPPPSAATATHTPCCKKGSAE